MLLEGELQLKNGTSHVEEQVLEQVLTLEEQVLRNFATINWVEERVRELQPAEEEAGGLHAGWHSGAARRRWRPG